MIVQTIQFKGNSVSQILVVDDNASNREFLVTLFQYDGHNVLEAANGSEALTVVRSHRPDLAIVDLMMPEMDGYEFARQVRSDRAISQTPIIFHSAAYDASQMVPLATACGVQHILCKPAEPEAVLRMVHEALATHSAEGMPVEDADHFASEHLRLLTNTLSQKADELQAANTRLIKVNDELEQRVKERTAELERSNADLEQFAYVAAHDLQEPLRKVIGYTGLLQKLYKAKLDADAVQFIEYATDGATRMQELIKDLLAYSRVAKTHTLAPTDVAAVVARSLADLKARFASRRPSLQQAGYP